MAFVAAEGGREVIFLDGSRFDAYGPDWKPSWPLIISESGTVVACRMSSLRSEKQCIGIDGRRGEEFERVGPPVLSRDGSRVAYRAHEGDRCFVVAGGRRGPEFEFMSDPAISADGTVVAYGAKESGKWWLVADGHRRVPIDPPPSGVFLSADGRSVGYWFLESPGNGASRVRVVASGRPGPSFTMVGTPAFSPDGKSVTYAADDGPRRYVVVGNRKVETPDRESDPVFSPDGRKVGYGARVGRQIWWKVLDAF